MPVNPRKRFSRRGYEIRDEKGPFSKNREKSEWEKRLQEEIDRKGGRAAAEARLLEKWLKKPEAERKAMDEWLKKHGKRK